jgi:hypothetical protein
MVGLKEVQAALNAPGLITKNEPLSFNQLKFEIAKRLHIEVDDAVFNDHKQAIKDSYIKVYTKLCEESSAPATTLPAAANPAVTKPAFSSTRSSTATVLKLESPSTLHHVSSGSASLPTVSKFLRDQAGLLASATAWCAATHRISAILLSLDVLQCVVSRMDDPRYMKNDDAPDCTICKKLFGFFVRRHHCRVCGILACDNCSEGRKRGCMKCQQWHERCTCMAPNFESLRMCLSCEKLGGISTATHEAMSAEKVQMSIIVDSTKQLASQGLSTDARSLLIAGCSHIDLQNAGLSTTLHALKTAGCDAKLLKQVGCHATTLHADGFTARDLKLAGYDLKTMKHAGYDVASLIACGYDVQSLKTVFSASDLRHAQIELCDMKLAGFDAVSLQNAGYSCSELKRVGFDALSLKCAGFDLESLKLAGFDASSLKTTGFSCTALKLSGFDCYTLLVAGFDLNALKNAGFTATTLKICKFDAAALTSAGFSANELKGAGFDASSLKTTGFSCTALKLSGFDCYTLLVAGFDLNALKNAGFTATTLKICKFDAAALTSAGFSANELKGAGFDALSLKEVGFETLALKKSGFGTIALKDAGCSLASLKAAGFDATSLKSAGFDLSSLKAEGFDLPALMCSGFDVKSLRLAGFCIGDFVESGFTNFQELKKSGFEVQHLYSAGLREICLMHPHVFGIPFSCTREFDLLRPLASSGLSLSSEGQLFLAKFLSDSILTCHKSYQMYPYSSVQVVSCTSLCNSRRLASFEDLSGDCFVAIHGTTSESNVTSISENGFRLSTAGCFGRGIYVAQNSSVAMVHTCPKGDDFRSAGHFVAKKTEEDELSPLLNLVVCFVKMTSHENVVYPAKPIMEMIYNGFPSTADRLSSRDVVIGEMPFRFREAVVNDPNRIYAAWHLQVRLVPGNSERLAHWNRSSVSDIGNNLHFQYTHYSIGLIRLLNGKAVVCRFYGDLLCTEHLSFAVDKFLFAQLTPLQWGVVTRNFAVCERLLRSGAKAYFEYPDFALEELAEPLLQFTFPKIPGVTHLQLHSLTQKKDLLAIAGLHERSAGRALLECLLNLLASSKPDFENPESQYDYADGPHFRDERPMYYDPFAELLPVFKSIRDSPSHSVDATVHAKLDQALKANARADFQRTEDALRRATREAEQRSALK